MRGHEWVLRLWPGLGPLWLEGSPSGLAWAVAFSFVLNLAIATTWLWPEWLSAWERLFLWCGLAAIWLFGLSVAPRRPAASSDTAGEDLFIRATNEYLKGNWYETEALLEQMLRADSRDVEARLMQATLFRRTGRFDEARRSLVRLSREPLARQWTEEVRREWELLEAPTDRQTEDESQPARQPVARAA
jgi:hypothetical protein